MLTSILMATCAVLPQQDADTSIPIAPSGFQGLVYDDMSQITRAPAQGLQLSPQGSDFGPENPNAVPQIRTYIPKLDGEGPDLGGKFSLRQILSEVLMDQTADQHIWARGRDYRASFGTEGFTVWPVFGKRSPQEFPVAFQLQQVTLGGEALQTRAEAPSMNGSVVEIGQGSLREVYYLDLDQVEQTFVFDQLPGSGELVVNLSVTSELEVYEEGGVIRFVHPEFGEVTYGQAFVRDASGRKESIQRTWTGSGITLSVPADFVASAQLPLTIDPPITSLVNSFGSVDDSFPDVAFDGRSNLWWAVWQDYTSATNTDCFASNWDLAGTQGVTLSVEITADSWSHPRIAYNYGSDRLLVVATADVAGVSLSRIEGRYIDASTNSLAATSFIISTIGALKLWPDVGGMSLDSTTNSNFCVVWSFQSSPTNHSVQYRVVDSSGGFLVPVTDVTSGPDNDIQTTVSNGMGNVNLAGDYWNIAWTTDGGTLGDGQGSIHARQVVFSGNPAISAGNFTVDAALNCAFPSITSRMDRNLVADGRRPSIVAYEREFATLSGPPFQRSIYAKVVTDSTAYGANAVSFMLEDVDLDLDQRDACIATDGDSFFIVYSEEFYGDVGSGDYDMYMLSGHVSETSSDVYLALSERHQNMSFSGTAERFGRVGTIRNGNPTTVSDDGCVFWMDGTDGMTSHIEGYLLESPTFDAGPKTAVGIQFCDANGNGGPNNFALDTSSWAWMEGTQQINSTHSVHCVDVTPNQFGYLLASLNPANINLPGGSAGRLCMTGSGRYTSAVQFSGATGTFLTLVNPMSIPQPTGNVSAVPGQTWHFQYWHRDLASGSPTSNFSSAVRLMFNP